MIPIHILGGLKSIPHSSRTSVYTFIMEVTPRASNHEMYVKGISHKAVSMHMTDMSNWISLLKAALPSTESETSALPSNYTDKNERPINLVHLLVMGLNSQVTTLLHMTLPYPHMFNNNNQMTRTCLVPAPLMFHVPFSSLILSTISCNFKFMLSNNDTTSSFSSSVTGSVCSCCKIKSHRMNMVMLSRTCVCETLMP